MCLTTSCTFSCSLRTICLQICMLDLEPPPQTAFGQQLKNWVVVLRRLFVLLFSFCLAQQILKRNFQQPRASESKCAKQSKGWPFPRRTKAARRSLPHSRFPTDRRPFSSCLGRHQLRSREQNSCASEGKGVLKQKVSPPPLTRPGRLVSAV